MGRARILVDAAVGPEESHWGSPDAFSRQPKVKGGAGMVRAKRLAKLTGAVISVVSGAEAFTLEERKQFRVLTDEQIESGDFEVAVLEWSDGSGTKTKLRRL